MIGSLFRDMLQQQQRQKASPISNHQQLREKVFVMSSFGQSEFGESLNQPASFAKFSAQQKSQNAAKN